MRAAGEREARDERTGEKKSTTRAREKVCSNNSHHSGRNNVPVEGRKDGKIRIYRVLDDFDGGKSDEPYVVGFV